jgi:tetratricopeptide (TPR) repeat protein
MDTVRTSRCRVVGLPVAVGLDLFKDRATEAEQIGRGLSADGKRLVTVHGRRGVGKSALAARVMDLLASGSWPHRSDAPTPARLASFSTRTDGISFERIFLDSSRLLEEDQQDALGGVWASSLSPSDKAAALVAALGDDTVLLLDNLEDHLTPEGVVDPEDLRSLLRLVLRSRRAPRLLVTTQVPLALPVELRRLETRVRLEDGLPVDDAIELLRELDPAEDGPVRRAPDARLAAAVHRVHGLPRALELIAGAMSDDYLTLPSLEEVLSGFTSRGDVVAQLAQDRYRTVDGDARLVLDLLAVVGRPVGREAVSWVLEPLAPRLDVAPVLADLARQQLISLDLVDRTFRLHPMDVDLIRAELDRQRADWRRSLDRRVADWYERSSPPRHAWTVVDDVQTRRHEFEHRLAAGDADSAALLLAEIDEFLVWRGSVAAVAAMRSSLEGRLEQPDVMVSHLLGLGLVRLVAGPMEEGVEPLRRARQLAVEMGDRRGLERALFMLGDVYRQLRRLDEAVEALDEAVRLGAELGDDERQSHSLLCLSLTHSYRGDADEALAVADRLTLLADSSASPLVRGRECDARSVACLLAGRWDDCVAAADAAVDAYVRAGVPEALGYVRNVRGLAQLRQGRIEEAVGSFEESRSDGVQQNSERLQGLALLNRAWAAWLAADLATAEDAAGRAGVALRGSARSDADAATALRAAAIARRTGAPADAARHLATMADLVVGNADVVPADMVRLEAARLPSATVGEDR